MQQDFQLELDGESSEPDEAHGDNYQNKTAKPAVSAQAQYEEPSAAYNNAIVYDANNKILDLKVGKLDYSVKKETGISTRANNARM